MKRHCHACGNEWTVSRQPGRIEACEKCGADLHVCLNCVHYDRAVAYQCRERRAEPVQEKDRSNYCEFYELARRVYAKDVPGGRDRQSEARDAFKKLFGD